MPRRLLALPLERELADVEDRERPDEGETGEEGRHGDRRHRRLAGNLAADGTPGDRERERHRPGERPQAARSLEVLAEGVHRRNRERRDRRDEHVEREAVVAGRVGEDDTEDDEGGEDATTHAAPTFAPAPDVPAAARRTSRTLGSGLCLTPCSRGSATPRFDSTARAASASTST